MNKTGILGMFILFLGLGALALQTSKPACAQLFAEDSCDPDYYDSLRSRAWIEAQREITQNQNLIFKGDSVLEYTCFDVSLNYLAGIIEEQPFFSMDPRWLQASVGIGVPVGPGTGTELQTDIAAALTPIMTTAFEYHDANFNHDLLGGRWVGEAYEFDEEVNPTVVYSCNTMARVWEVARCMNFIDNPAEDGFFTFEEYWSSEDKRFLPDRCPAIAPPLFEEEYAEALIDEETDWVEDELVTYFELIYPPGGGCGGGDSLIETGLTVSRAEENPTNYEEHVCLVPGCFYDAGAQGGGVCALGRKPPNTGG